MLVGLSIAVALAASPKPAPPAAKPPADAVGTPASRCAVEVAGRGPLAKVGDDVTTEIRRWTGRRWTRGSVVSMAVGPDTLEAMPWMRDGAEASCWRDPDDVIVRVAVRHLAAHDGERPRSWETLTRGRGPAVGPEDLIEVTLQGWTAAGARAPSFVLGQPEGAMHAGDLPRLGPGLDSAWQVIRPGSTTRFWLPEPFYGVVVVDLSVIDVTPTPRAPVPVRRPPREALPVAQGAWQLISSDPTADPPITAYDKVCAHLTGWSARETLRWDVATDDGVCLVPVQGAPDQVPAAVAETLPGLERGDTVRLWTAGAQGPELWQVSVDTVTRGVPPPPDVARPPPDATVTASGLAYKLIRRGTGDPHPVPGSRVTVRYTGWTTDGVSFETSGDDARSFALKDVMKGWSEGLQQLSAGDKARLWIPEALAYGNRPGKPAGMLVFDIELVSFTSPPPPPPDVDAAPADAIVTASGLAYKAMFHGDGAVHPGARSRVTVHYTGWTTDGISFDSSYNRGKPSIFSVHALIAGWTEGLQLMVQGDRFRFWIPEALAYKGQAGKPAGMLVFDVELLEITDARR